MADGVAGRSRRDTARSLRHPDLAHLKIPCRVCEDNRLPQVTAPCPTRRSRRWGLFQRAQPLAGAE